MWQATAGMAFVGLAMSSTANALLHAHVHAAARAEFEAHTLGAGSKFVGFQALARRAGGPTRCRASWRLESTAVGVRAGERLVGERAGAREADRHVGAAGRGAIAFMHAARAFQPYYNETILCRQKMGPAP
ncbi:hypothetical protein ON010_g7172 [Phytophthora cinnamomi]|nr:hypothetical protein ON010_g7172 [Phytophthora cinnamomi]